MGKSRKTSTYLNLKEEGHRGGEGEREQGGGCMRGHIKVGIFSFFISCIAKDAPYLPFIGRLKKGGGGE